MKKGFTLIELLVVIAIVGILAIGILVLINPLQKLQLTRDTVRKGDIGNISRSLNNYLVDFGKYPDTLTDIIGSEMRALPKDPKDPTYQYAYTVDNSQNPPKYTLCAYLEANDKVWCISSDQGSPTALALTDSPISLGQIIAVVSTPPITSAPTITITPTPTDMPLKIALDLYPAHYAVLQNPNAWIQKLSDAYYAFSDLVGIAPYGGAVITIKEYPVSEMAGALMYAGNPIHWADPYVVGALTEINNYNDLSFGPIHEIGHDFDIVPYSYYYIGNGGTPNDAEQWANFKLTYVADTLSSSYPTATFGAGAAGHVPIGQFSKTYFEDIFMQEWLSSPRIDWKTMKADAYTGFLHSLAREHGWNMFKNTFRDYQNITDPLPTDDLQKVNLFVSLLANNSGANIKQEFIDFGIPVGDYIPSPNPGPSGYIFCGFEWETCSFTGTAQVAFGANGSFNYGTYTNSTLCSWSVFGDPLSGVAKACYYNSTVVPQGPPGYIFCATEWGTCTFTGTAQVAFGANGSFNYGTYTNSTLCSWSVFGDPAPGISKRCFHKLN